MTVAPESGAQGLEPEDQDALQEILGYLNFSSGKPDAGFQKNLNRWHERLSARSPWAEFRRLLLDELDRLHETSPAFANSDQAAHVIPLVFDEVWPAYRRHHADLLFHLNDTDFEQPFLLARLFETVLAQGGPWTEGDRLVGCSLDRLNDFIGHRPVAILENEQKMEPYNHERFRPIPLCICGAGTAVGKYHDLIARTIELFGETPSDILVSSHFDLAQLDELALDPRAYDHTLPSNKRTNYIFGEWDPHLIDTKGRYRRFVIRQIILDSLLEWIDNAKGPYEDALYDASAVLCGTVLMASAISGSGPDTHDSSVTLTSLLPVVARQRDAFYARLQQNTSGERAKRLARQAKRTRQPFGHVRQRLNLYLAGYGARQMEYRHLAILFARMGQADAARERALSIPSASVRFECEIQWRITAAHQQLDRGALLEASRLAEETEDLLHRGIQCGAIVDPWNILGFQGQFPLFSVREDSIPDQRIETLLDLMERIFGVYSRAISEAAVRGEADLTQLLSDRFRALAQYWDQFAAHAVEDLPKVLGQESWESATHVSNALSEWRAAGEAAGDISFWRGHVERFQSPKAYAEVVDVLLDHGDHVAAMGLLMQWLNQADHVALEAGPYSIHAQLLRWMRHVTGSAEDGTSHPCDWKTLSRLFDYLEANAGEYWSVPALEDAANREPPPAEGSRPSETNRPAGHDLFDEPDADDSEDQLFRAAYDGVVFRDSALDGQRGDLFDGNYAADDSELEFICRAIEPRVKFLMTLALLWQIAGSALAVEASEDDPDGDDSGAADTDQRTEAILRWRRRVHDLQDELMQLTRSIWKREIALPSGEHDSNVEYDLNLQTKFYLLHNLITTHVNCRTAERHLLCCLPPKVFERELPHDERLMIRAHRAIMRRDISSVRRSLPSLTRELSGKSLLYVPLDEGGPPDEIAAVRMIQTEVRFLLSHLPRLGMLAETWHVLKTSQRMEKASRPTGTVVSEFDRLFRSALRHSLECVVHATVDTSPTQDPAVAQDGPASSLPDNDLIDLVTVLVEHYLELWLKHSRTMRLSTVEALDDGEFWMEVKEFIGDYGADLFHAKMLTLGNVRAILHNGIEWFLDYLEDTEDPLHPIGLLEAVELEAVDFDDVVDMLEVIYGSVVDKFDRFLEYNTTTTQSDYGEMFYHLLDFLRMEAAYDRDAWNCLPYGIAHTVLSSSKQTVASRIWETLVEVRTRDMADKHLAALRKLERRSGIRLPIVADRLNERLVRPLAVNRMLALIPQAMEDARRNQGASEAFEALRKEIDEYLTHTSGSGVDVADWLQNLEREVNRHDPGVPPTHHAAEFVVTIPQVSLSGKQLRQQMKDWNRPLGRKTTTRKKSSPRKGTRKKKD